MYFCIMIDTHDIEVNDDVDDMNDDVSYPLTDADHQDSCAAIQCIPDIIIIIIIITIFTIM